MVIYKSYIKKTCKACLLNKTNIDKRASQNIVPKRRYAPTDVVCGTGDRYKLVAAPQPVARDLRVSPAVTAVTQRSERVYTWIHSKCLP